MRPAWILAESTSRIALSSDAGVVGVVLAAGWGRRMGGPKALLRTPDGRTFLQAVTDTLREGGIGRLVVVVGPWWAEAQAPEGCDLVMNPDPDRGVISSLRLAIRRAWPAGFEGTESGLLMALVDHPAVRPGTVRDLIAAHRADPHRIVVPTFRDGTRVRRGHPVVFPAWTLAEFFGAAAGADGPRAVVRAHPEAVAEVEVADPGVLMDLDSQACYGEWLRKVNAPEPAGAIGGKP